MLGSLRTCKKLVGHRLEYPWQGLVCHWPGKSGPDSGSKKNMLTFVKRYFICRVPKHEAYFIVMWCKIWSPVTLIGSIFGGKQWGPIHGLPILNVWEINTANCTHGIGCIPGSIILKCKSKMVRKKNNYSCNIKLQHTVKFPVVALQAIMRSSPVCGILFLFLQTYLTLEPPRTGSDLNSLILSMSGKAVHVLVQ